MSCNTSTVFTCNLCRENSNPMAIIKPPPGWLELKFPHPEVGGSLHEIVAHVCPSCIIIIKRESKS